MSQALFTSMIPRQVCCWWSGHSPQSCGQPLIPSVENSRGMVPGLLNFEELVYMLGVAIDQRFERPVIGAALAHKDLVVADQDVRVNDGGGTRGRCYG